MQNEIVRKVPERRAEEPKRAVCGSFGLLRPAQQPGRRRFFFELCDSSADIDPAPSARIFNLTVPLIKGSAEHRRSSGNFP